MDQPLHFASAVVLALALVGCAYLVLAGLATRAYLRAPAVSAAPQPAITVLKPLHGDEPGLEAALATLFAQDYAGRVQVVMGLQDPADSARAVAERLRARYPAHDIEIVIDARLWGANRKISNLINMTPRAWHDLLVIADSDIAAPPDYLSRLAAALAAPGVGVASCPYYGGAETGLWSRLAAMGLTYQFLPSVAVGLKLGMAKPCMGSTIALRRQVLAEIGGFEAFADQLADDYAIGAAVRAAGYQSVVPPLLVAHGCTDTGLGELVAHELRWSRTVRGIDPAGFFGSGVTHAFALALLGVLLSGGSPVSLVVLALAASARLWMIRQVEKVAPPTPGAMWLFPARDILSFAVFAGSFFVRVVNWRGARLRVDSRGGLTGV